MLPLIKAIQKHVAAMGITFSIARGQSRGEVVVIVLDFLSVLPLKSFAVSTEGSFRKVLDESTTNLLTILPKPAQSWGIARKYINIFFRDAFFNSHLASEYGLESAKPFYGVPLDGFIAYELHKHANNSMLPRWFGITRLTPAISETYQASALDLSHKWKFDRVYLDTYLRIDGLELPVSYDLSPRRDF